ncbi:MAG: hypothetical protein AAGA54_07460 [Myxococcota bacterium]
MSKPRSPLHLRLLQLRDAALPFVTRTFRGPRLKRFGAISLLLGVLSVLMGVWLSFGRGDFEQEVRRGLDLERDRWAQDRITFTITVHDDFFYDLAERDVRSARATGTRSMHGESGHAVREAYSTLLTATTQTAPPQFASDQARAEALLAKYPLTSESGLGEVELARMYDPHFDWYAEDARTRLDAIVEQDLLPNVSHYRSPLNAADAVRVTGAVAGGFVVLLLLIVAPLASGSAIAQEVHENTLQPILGTRLRPVDVVVGLTASGVALGVLLAVPSLVVMLIAAAVGGALSNLPTFLLLLPAASGFLVMLTQLLGFGLGRRWAAGIVSTVLTAALCVLMLFGVGLGMNLEGETTGLIAMMPPTGLVHGLRELFLPAHRLQVGEPEYAVFISMVAVLGYGVLAFIMARALTRRIEGRTQVSLSRVEAFGAAATALMMALAVIPEFGRDDALPAYFVSLGLVAVPWQLILAGRIPVGDGPSSLRTIPLRRTMLELAGFAAIHLGAIVLIFGFELRPSAMGTFHLLWALTVLGLVAVRMVAVPMGIVSSLYAMFCLGAVVFAMVHAAVFTDAVTNPDTFGSHVPAPFILFEASPMLGVLQVALTALIPAMLVRALRKGSAGLR